MELSYERLQARLGQRAFQYHDSVGSTNDLAMQWLQQGAVAGSAVIADEQRTGRGRLGRVWYTPPHVALAVSIILKPPALFLGRMSMLGAVAVADLCTSLGIAQVGIKWPNDVLVNGLKVCGILPEVAWEGAALGGVVLGMGVNVRVDFTDSELAHTAISLETALAKTLDRADLIATLLERVDWWSAQIHEDALFQTWQARLVTLGRTITVGQVHGIAERVDQDGALFIRVADGRLERVIAGDVVMSA